MKNRINKKIIGVIVIILMCLIPYVLYTGKSIDNTELGWTGRIIIIVCLLWFTKMILFNKKARERRIKMYGSSNFFVSLFKEEKNEKENSNNTDWSRNQ